MANDKKRTAINKKSMSSKKNRKEAQQNQPSFATSRILKSVIIIAVLGISIAVFVPDFPHKVLVLYKNVLSLNDHTQEKHTSNPTMEKSSYTKGTPEDKVINDEENYTQNKVNSKPSPLNKTESTSKTKIDNKPKKQPKTENTKAKELPPEIKNFKATILNEMVPKKTFVDGRRIPPIELLPQKATNSSVKVYLFEEFLSNEECDGLIKVHDKHVLELSKKDPVICFDSIKTLRRHLKDAKKGKIKVNPSVFSQGTTCLNQSFSSQFKDFTKSSWSYSTAFYPGESRFSKVFGHRVAQSTALLDKNGGKFQITSYPTGIGYKKHTDCIIENADKRDRYATILVYLKDVEEGGETKFPELGIWVKPKKGRALVWNNMNPDGECEPHSIHDASVVKSGQKYILQRWYYYKSFYSLGKRPPEPQIPPRSPDQPRVSCDEYAHGSCRWYDEWNYEHILEYQQQQHTLA